MMLEMGTNEVTLRQATMKMNDSPGALPVNNARVHASKGSDHYLNMSVFER